MTICNSYSGHRVYDYDKKPAQVRVQCDKCSAVFTDIDNTGGLPMHDIPGTAKTVKRARLTPHQTEVLSRIQRWAKHKPKGIRAEDIGSKTALLHLADKGYIRLEEEYGSRGGTYYRIFLIEEAE